MYSPTVPFSEYLQGEQTKYPELTSDAIQTLKDSLKDDPNLPPIPDKKIIAFLHSCYFNQELAKTTVRHYYKFHFDIPQVFRDLDPFAAEMEQNYNCVSVSQMPCTNLDKNIRVLFVQLKDHDHGLFDFVSLYKYLAMWLHYLLVVYGTCDGVIAVLDSSGLSWRHMVKFPIGVTHKMLKYMELGLPIRLKEIHILNIGSAVHMIMKVVTRLANKDLLEKIILHSSGSEDIFNSVPRNLIPVEVGGTGESHHLCNDKLYKHMKDLCDIFLEENEIFNE